MKTPRQIKAITSQLEVLEELKEQLESLITDINTVTSKGKSWINDSDSQNFLEMNQYLINETSRCLRRCYDLTNDDCGLNSDTPESFDQAENVNRSKDDKRYQSLADMVNKINSTLVKHSRKMKKLQQNSSEQETRIESTCEKIKENDSKFEELHNELQGASQFMTRLEIQSTKLFDKVKENKEQIETLLHLPQELADQKESLTSLLKTNESQDKSQVVKMEEFIQGHVSNSHALNTKYDHLSNLVKANDEELSQIKKYITSESLSDIKKKLEENDEYLKRIEINQRKFSDGNRKIAEDIEAKIQANTEITSILEVKFQSLETQLSNANGEFSKSKDVIESLKSRVEIIKDQLSTCKSNIKKLDTKITAAESEIVSQSRRRASSRDVMAACRIQLNCSEEMNFKKDTILKCFKKCLLNIGQCYDKDAGTFTAPCAGLYLCSLMIESENGMEKEFSIYSSDRSDNETARGRTHTNSSSAVACLVTVFDLNQGDEVYVKSLDEIRNIKLSNYSYFVCVLLQKK
ncbi:nucleoprotein TPR-like [Biomphalaria glabrata]|uniref:Nucleoprotein TPR-like n=1 Tax=Biomphalaria glabrata TaxID=6526 RepID=A0A9W2ZLT3_BIOGL|nr:nucleoprotein TPR-like [Biomphalaria glabrata]XP_055875908.1 nucleoprotein TPR-like [Biomphalaria glabrata]